MPPELRAEFGEPSDGWLAIHLRADAGEFSATFSHVYPTLRDLCGALCDAWVGTRSRRVVFLLEPAELELNMVPGNQGLCELTITKFPDHRRTLEAGEVVFEFEGMAREIVVAFWRALRRLETSLTHPEFRVRWRDPFPDLEMASLTELVSKGEPPQCARG